MSNLEVTIRETAARLLREGQVAVVLGYEAGSVPFRTAPAFIERAEDASGWCGTASAPTTSPSTCPS